MKFIHSYDILKEKHIIFNLYYYLAFYFKSSILSHYQDMIWMDNLGKMHNSLF